MYMNGDGIVFVRFFVGKRVRLIEVGILVIVMNGDDVEFSDDDSGMDGGSNFFGGFDIEIDVVFRVINDDNGFEMGMLIGMGLFLDGFDFYDFIFEFG